ncbi:hypothetical protein A3Q56_01640 [Intoshia linei]|uniref:isoleucine--tRNA ligase n=1 Tax=Intoshia linei TaxID=1819745 RepID=A0A177BAE1_9BILA|nr:hypothetical protein A3Q56_01640 [Intoshia linei]
MAELVREFNTGDSFFPKMENEIMKLWDDNEIFKKSQKYSQERKKNYIFYDGPPFATGLPHYGNILAGIVKDVVTRWFYQKGFKVDRRFGWDCHGLPVEYQLDKSLGIKGPEDIEKMGIANYNNKCRGIVMKYNKEWEFIVKRIGRWIDFKNDYKTMYCSYMESVWWIFKEMYNKGLIYCGYKIMPFSTGCCTPLSNFEAGQNFKNVQNNSIYVSFPLVKNNDTSFIAWSTTTWTFPSQLAMCVNPKHTYVTLFDKKKNHNFIITENRVSHLYKNEDDYTIISKCIGKELENMEYVEIFNYYSEKRKNGAFRILVDNYVSDDAGTGIVSQAPYFGEDDYRVCLANKVVNAADKPICPLDFCGRFVEPIDDFVGVYIKDSEKGLIKNIKDKGRLFKIESINHAYPFCWRSDTPLVYRSIPSWFVNVTSIKDNLLKSLEDVYWVPENVKEKRFGNWLRDSRDWAISRNRYWGNPIPIWISEDEEEVVCIGSLEELEKLSGVSGITDMHREFIDHITIPSKRPGKPPLKRISHVFDCWFESASMFLAQKHYPFENSQDLNSFFPADFIAEGIDQTRGWFYTLIVISTALFGKSCYKNVIGHGLVLAEDGQKMSKSKKNYPDPLIILDTYGADALRLYLVNSPVVTSQNLRFNESGIHGIVKEVLIPMYNTYRYLMQNIVQLKEQYNIDYEYAPSEDCPSNYMDKWMISMLQSLIKDTDDNMSKYLLAEVLPNLLSFFDNFSKLYINMNKYRMIGKTTKDDQLNAINTHFTIQYNLSIIMAPFVPFICDHIYQGLSKFCKKDIYDCDTSSVHFLPIPNSNIYLTDKVIERQVKLMNNVIYLGLKIRTIKNIRRRMRLKGMIVIVRNEQEVEDLNILIEYIRKELNIEELTISSDRKKYKIDISINPNFKTLSVDFKLQMKGVTAAIRGMDINTIEKFVEGDEVVQIGEYKVKRDQILMNLKYNGNTSNCQKYVADSHQNMIVLLDTSVTAENVDKSLASEICHRIQKLRKISKILPTDNIIIYFKGDNELLKIFNQYNSYISETVGKPVKLVHKNFMNDKKLISNQFEINSSTFDLFIEKCY